jgi:hypothetical protein
VLFSSTDMVAAAGDVPAVYTTDGGRTWHVISLPVLPALAGGQGRPLPYMLPLPSGGLLDVEEPTLLMLPPGGNRWCPVNEPAAMKVAVGHGLGDTFTVIGDQLWWLTSNSPNGTMVPAGAWSTTVATLTCL